MNGYINTTVPPSTPPHFNPSWLSDVRRSSETPRDSNACWFWEQTLYVSENWLTIMQSTWKWFNFIPYLFDEWHVLLILCIGTIFILYLNSNNRASILILQGKQWRQIQDQTKPNKTKTKQKNNRHLTWRGVTLRMSLSKYEFTAVVKPE